MIALKMENLEKLDFMYFHGSQSPIRLLRVSCVIKSYFSNLVQPIDLIFYKMIEMIEQNILNSIVQIFYLGPDSLFLARSIFSADDVIRIKSGNAI